MELDEVLHRLLGEPDAAGRFHPDHAAVLLVDVADRLEHAQRHGEGRRARELAGRGLDEVRARGHREERRSADVVIGAELGDLEDHLQVRVAGRFLHAHDLVVDFRVPAGKERATVDHHVDLVGALVDDPRDLLELQLDRGLARRKRRCDRGDLDARALDARDGGRDEVRVDADRGDRRHARLARVGPNRLRGKRGHLAGSVLALERRQVHHPDGELEGEDLRLLLDRALRKRCGALLECDRVDGADPWQPRLERKLETTWQNWRLRHWLSLAPDESCAFARIWPRRYARNVRGRARALLLVGSLALVPFRAGTGAHAAAPRIGSPAAKPGSAWS